MREEIKKKQQELSDLQENYASVLVAYNESNV